MDDTDFLKAKVQLARSHRFELHRGNCVEVMRDMADASADSVVTDPPYELTSARPGARNAATEGKVMKGFMGMAWDGSGIAYSVEMWAEALRVLKPGGHLLAFSGSRTYHRMVCAIEDAGFEVRDQIMWIYGSGFPKSLDVSKAIDKRKDWAALEAFQVKVRAARLALGISQSEAARRIELIGEDESLGGGGFMWFETGMRLPSAEQYAALKRVLSLGDECDGAFEEAEREVIGQHRATAGGQNMRHGIGGGDEPLPPGQITAAGSDLAREWQGWGTALKPAHEPIVVARKPLIGTVAANVLRHGTGAINIDGCRVKTDETLRAGAGGLWSHDRDGTTPQPALTSDVGRWPANLIHDGSDDVLSEFPDQESGSRASGVRTGMGFHGAYGDGGPAISGSHGSAARFFYTAKAAAEDRHEGIQGSAKAHGRNHHPTVKPTVLMRYLCRLVTPPGGLVLDPFMGSGSTGKAAMLEGFRFVGIDLSPEYVEIARARIAAAMRMGHQPSLNLEVS